MKTVNLFEAFDSGKEFRHSCTSDNPDAWFKDREDFYRSVTLNCSEGALEEMIEGRYILKEKSITITESEFDEIFDKLELCGYTYDSIKKEKRDMRRAASQDVRKHCQQHQ